MTLCVNAIDDINTIEVYQKEATYMARMYLTQRRGRDVIVIDTRPSKVIRRAKQRLQRRQLEIARAFGK